MSVCVLMCVGVLVCFFFCFFSTVFVLFILSLTILLLPSQDLVPGRRVTTLWRLVTTTNTIHPRFLAHICVLRVSPRGGFGCCSWCVPFPHLVTTYGLVARNVFPFSSIKGSAYLLPIEHIRGPPYSFASFPSVFLFFFSHPIPRFHSSLDFFDFPRFPNDYSR